MAAPAAPAAAPAFTLTLGLWALASLLVLIGLKAIWADTIGWALQKLADILHFSAFRIKVDLGGPLRAIDNTVENALGRAILENEKALGLFWHTTKALVEYAADSIADFGQDVHGAIHGLVYGTIPNAAAAAVRPVASGVGSVTRVVTTVQRVAIPNVRALVKAVEAQLDRDFGIARRGIDHIGKAILPRILARERALESDVAGLQQQVGRVIPHRLTRLERWLGAGVIGGAAVAAITRVFPYWQCSNVKRFNRNVCRSPLGSLDWLFGLALATLVALDVEQVAHVGQDVTDELGNLWQQMGRQGS